MATAPFVYLLSLINTILAAVETGETVPSLFGGLHKGISSDPESKREAVLTRFSESLP